MKYLRNLVRPKNNIEEIILLMLTESGVRFTEKNILHQLQSHPDYPSMSTIRDVLCVVGIESLSLKVNDFQSLCAAKEPFLCQIESKERLNLFAFVYGISEDNVDWYNPSKHCREVIRRQQFSELFTGYAMFLDTAGKSDEPNYKANHQKEIASSLFNAVVLSALPVITLASLGCRLYWGNIRGTFCVMVLALLLLLGCVLCGLLLLYEYNAFTPLFEKICGANRKTGCSAILHSSASRFLNIPWVVIGLSYFVGILTALVGSLFSLSMIHLVAYVHLLTLPYVVFSVYYQYRVAKQWCPLCLSVMALILIIFICYVIAGFFSLRIPIIAADLFSLIVCLFLSFISVYFLWSSSQKSKEARINAIELSRLKLRKDVFWLLLQKEREVTMPTDDFGIVLGNPHGSIHIVKVCNPFCVHCANAQPILQNKVKTNQDVKLQMVFAVDPHTEYYKQTPIDLFLSLYHEGADIEAVLADWYSNPSVDIEMFKQKYPVKQSYTEWNADNTEKMYRFCQETGIMGTPTIFINGHELPANYQIGDMLYCI